MSKSHIETIAEFLSKADTDTGTEMDPGAGVGAAPETENPVSYTDVARLLIAPDGVSMTSSDGETTKMNVNKVVVMLPNGKLVSMDEVLAKLGY